MSGLAVWPSALRRAPSGPMPAVVRPAFLSSPVAAVLSHTMPMVAVCMALMAVGAGCAKRSPAPEAVAQVAQVAGIRAKVVGSSSSGERIQLVLEPGAEIVAALSAFITANHFVAVHFDGFGAVSDAKVAWYDPLRRDYKITSLAEHMEIVSLLGDAAPTDDKVGFHAHVGLAKVDGSMVGGHLLEAHVYPTVEVFLITSPTPIHRKHDDALNSNLLVP
jgi:uncharacterized protein